MILTHGSNSISRGESPFILLNNCDTLETIDEYTQLKSLVGTNIFARDANLPGIVSTSSIFTNSTSFYRSASGYIRWEPNIQLPIGYLTYELYCSKDSDSFESYFSGSIFCILRDKNSGRIAIGGKNINNIQPVGSAYVYKWTSEFDAIALDIYNSNYFHLAGVINTTTRHVTAFVNGNLLGTYEYPSDSYVLKMSENGFSGQCIEFISIRKGDFSNNLQSFTVPTEKYHL